MDLRIRLALFIGDGYLFKICTWYLSRAQGLVFFAGWLRAVVGAGWVSVLVWAWRLESFRLTFLALTIELVPAQTSRKTLVEPACNFKAYRTRLQIIWPG